MIRPFSDKLRVVMRIAGCETQKALYARLKAVNPETAYDPIRAYKWIQGRSSPRNRAVYDDLARLLEMEATGDWLRNSSYEEFYSRVCARYGDILPSPSEEIGPGETETPSAETMDPGGSLPAYLVGSYFSVSRAWSPHRPGTLIAGVTTLSRDSDGRFQCDYLECLPWGDLRMTGAVQRVGRNMAASIADSDAEMAINFTYSIPPAPAAILAGVMSGVTLSDAEMRPIAGRVLSLRLLDGEIDPARVSGYLGLNEDELAEKLRFCGLSDAQVSELAPDILNFLVDPGDRGVIEAPASMINAMIAKVLGN
ncbi:hypothetical protein [Nisaea sediminum]|uniref:hypothetical protein n=1 Tax=Nisaea sediminum TaxID=2775867 RepID=UPI0018667010|nr:hypothetical protein [Nisaea sediminum]